MHKVDDAIKRVVQTVSQWEGVDTITVMDYSKDIYDPYFFVSLDVYYQGAVPREEVRRSAFTFAGGFEAGRNSTKDRFFIEELPFRIEYKSLHRFEALVTGGSGGQAGAPVSKISATQMRDTGTYSLYRLAHARILFQRTDWIERMRSQLSQVPDSFWEAVRAAAQVKMEHHLSDLGAAALRGDSLFFTISAAGFLKSLCRTVYAINRCFEPSVRIMSTHILTLQTLPEAFAGTLDNFTRSNETSLNRKYEIAQLLAKRILGL
ncbi:DUF4037 domain-containing protein [Spirochaeta lutea]|uniref:DUF4037 domain-containing protein n=1 Tax=Spirochaeta lutea TaxID=1480694 RepID=A0A098QUR5_9SPIO|nr:DUF4037 domain-containing protein [Spirochaeta lutea]KGE71444.1 hypothetical protein DC28_11705 [Spirochaeta lutea]